jgi:hypothetical protein
MSQALEQLSKNRGWWVRLYVAELLHQYAELRTSELVNRLSEDPNRIVREVIAEEPLRR